MSCVRRAQVQKEARHAFGALLDRASASDRIRGVLALLKRYENLFRLPTRIRQASEMELYEQVTDRAGAMSRDECDLSGAWLGGQALACIASLKGQVPPQGPIMQGSIAGMSVCLTLWIKGLCNLH